jgi:GNAT superfamily N-acetyltransferase
MLVRYTPDYKDMTLQLMHAMHKESRYRGYEVSDTKLLNLLKNPHVFCMLSVIKGEAIGFFMGIVQPMWFSEKKYGFDLALYIVPKSRGGTSAARLVKEFEKFCQQQGCSEINLSSSAEISTDLAHRLYLGLGYQDCGFIVRKEI